MAEEKKEIFRKKSLERVSSPEQLNDYLHVTSPAVWVVLAAVIVLLASLFVWSSVTAVESYATGSAEVRGNADAIPHNFPGKLKSARMSFLSCIILN